MSIPIVIAAKDWRQQTWQLLSTISNIPLKEFWIHHSGSSTKTFQTLLANERYHVKTLKWRALGYNFAVVTNRIDPGNFARIFVGRGWCKVGGHTRGRNSISHAVLLVGNWETATDEEIEAASRSVAWLVLEGVKRGCTVEVVSGGHREAPNQATACPGNAGIKVARRALELVSTKSFLGEEMADLSPEAQKFYQEQYKNLQALETESGEPDPARPTTLPNIIQRVRKFIR